MHPWEKKIFFRELSFWKVLPPIFKPVQTFSTALFFLLGHEPPFNECFTAPKMKTIKFHSPTYVSTRPELHARMQHVAGKGCVKLKDPA